MTDCVGRARGAKPLHVMITDAPSGHCHVACSGLDTPPEDELPLGARVAALEGRAVHMAPLDGEGDEAGPSGALPEGSAKADSLAVLLTQALRR